MSFIDTIVGDGIGGLVKSVTGLLDKVVTTDEERGQIKAEMQRIANESRESIQQTLRTELAAKERIIIAEMQQGDKFTKRARPTIVYAGLFMIAVNYVIVPIMQVIIGANIVRIELPAEFWMAWGGVTGIWSLGRSAERVKGTSKIISLITGSQEITSIFDR